MNSVEKYLKFPNNLDTKRYVQIIVYETQFADTKQLISKISDNLTSNIDTSDNKNVSNNKIENNVSESASLVSIIGSSKLSNNIVKNINNRINNKNIGNSKLQEKKIKDIIYLPLPNNVTEKIGHEWTTEQGLFSTLLNYSKVSSVVANKAQEATNAYSKMFGQQQVIINPDYIQMYKGTSLRTFNMTWSFIPNNVEEATTIFSIIKKLKYYSSATNYVGKGMALVSPNFFKILFKNDILQDSLQFDETVINSIDINYSESGFMEMMHDGMTKSVVISISFTERTIKTAKDWR